MKRTLGYLVYAVAFVAVFFVAIRLSTLESLLLLIAFILWRIERHLEKGVRS